MKAAIRARHAFVVCIQNRNCDDLIVGKIYKTLPDRTAAAASHLRVVDESGEDYLYPARYFVFVDLPTKARRALTRRRTTSRIA